MARMSQAACYGFAQSFLIWTTIEECLNPPVIFEKGRGWYTTEPFSEPAVFDFPEGIGRRARERRAREPWAALHLTAGLLAYVVLEADVELSPGAECQTTRLVERYRALLGEHENWDAYRQPILNERLVMVRLVPSRSYGCCSCPGHRLLNVLARAISPPNKHSAQPHNQDPQINSSVNRSVTGRLNRRCYEKSDEPPGTATWSRCRSLRPPRVRPRHRLTPMAFSVD